MSVVFCRSISYVLIHSSCYADNESHIQFRATCRKFVEEEILPYSDDWATRPEGYPYKELHPKGYKAGVLGAIYPAKYGGTVPEGASKTDPFHELIMWDELSRCGTIPAAEGILGQRSEARAARGGRG